MSKHCEQQEDSALVDLTGGGFTGDGPRFGGIDGIVEVRMRVKKGVFQRLKAILKAGWLSVIEYTTPQSSMGWSKDKDFQIQPGMRYEIFDPTDRCECCGRDYTNDESLKHVSQLLESGLSEKEAKEFAETQGYC